MKVTLNNWKAYNVGDYPLVMARFFERPKCKPWDIVKGRRMSCCHGLGGHTPYCFEWIDYGTSEVI